MMSEIPKLYIEAFRAPIMIAGSFGPYLAISARDHETARAEGGFSQGARTRGAGMVAQA
jgi:hypothetical protein